MRLIVNTFRLLPIFIKILYKVFFTNKLHHKPILINKIKQLEIEFETQLDTAYHKRFHLYTIIATIFISWLETLRNQRLNQQQKTTALLFCGLTPLFDDLFDDFHYSKTEITLLSQKKLQRHTVIEKICVALFEEIEQLNGHLEWTELWQKVIDYQINSLEQKNPAISKMQIKDITFGKGGYSLLLYLEAISPNAYSQAEADAVFQMGGIIQLTNDIFDVFKDRNEGIFTLATSTSDMNDLRVFYENEVQKNIQQFKKLAFPAQNINDFLLQYMLIVSRGYVALDQFQALQDRDNGHFKLHQYSRKELICDMELWRNIKKSLLYTLKSQF
jgi:hypothetical protein